MCYSALIDSANRLSIRTKARVDRDAYLDLFTQRADVAEAVLDGQKLEKITLSRCETWEFYRNTEDSQGKAIHKQIDRWYDLEKVRLAREIVKQRARVEENQAKLKVKLTKTAEKEVGVGSRLLEAARSELERLRSEPDPKFDAWIWPKYHFAGVYLEHGKEIIRPFRYLLRPDGEPPEFDRTHSGAYNCMGEKVGLHVMPWGHLLGEHHGYFVVRRFRERQDVDLMASAKKLKVVGPPKARKEFEFDPGSDIFVPFIWDRWKDPAKKTPDLWSAGAITCKPPEEVEKAGIRRLLTPMKAEYLEKWVHPQKDLRAEYKKMLADYEWSKKLEFAEVA